MIRCTVAEMSRAVTRQLGINGFMWGADLRDFPFVSNIGGVNPTSFGQPAGVPVTVDGPFLGDGTGVLPTTTLSFAFPRVQMQVFIQALQQNSLLRILAEPNLVTISGRTASFLAGGEFPVPVPQSGGAGGGQTTITIEYREFGTRLSFTPVVLDNQMMRMNIAPEISELDQANGVVISGFRVPGLNSRRVETTVECASGQTLALAGLISESVRVAANHVPWLGEVPVLGPLFSSTEFQKRVTELVILVTPEIVAPLNPGDLPPLPGEGYVDPSDWQLYALGMLNGAEGAKPAEEDQVPEPSNSSAPMGPYGMSDYDETGAAAGGGQP
jgi:pilus assembly protein CpaC